MAQPPSSPSEGRGYPLYQRVDSYPAPPLQPPAPVQYVSAAYGHQQAQNSGLPVRTFTYRQ